MRDRFPAKTWIHWVRLLACGGVGLFAVALGVLFWTGLMTDAYGEERPSAGPPAVIVGSCLLAVGAMAAAQLAALATPPVRCFRQGVECSVVGATSLDGVPMVPALVRVAWAVLTLQGFRSTRFRIPWEWFGGAEVLGIPMAYELVLHGAAYCPFDGRTARALTFGQAALADHPHLIANILNAWAADPSMRERLPEWTLASPPPLPSTGVR